MTLGHNLQEARVRDGLGFYFDIKKIFNGSEVLNDKELAWFNKLRGLVKKGINQIYVDTENTNDYEEILKIYKLILDGKTPDASKLQKNFVLGWIKYGAF